MVRAVATIADCATDMLAKVFIDRYLGAPTYFSKRLLAGYRSKNSILIATNQYLFVIVIGVR